MTEQQKDTIFLDFLACAKGIFLRSLTLLEPSQSDDFSVISGSILLIVALEKLVKNVIYQVSPLMILYQKLDFQILFKYSIFRASKAIASKIKL
ncbi:hypothetical protein FEK30_08250 [Picosynechococcus sp. PCC 11901]|uniref:hypothetical protein n=1 Tax=Picosynechococcus sp. PCC 11901 TaxID=2579791 RepID=UPI0010FBD880|nr:hypothetical protein [Picosynechococcus sp. PCC 11901]QCS49431.1 hypothetical protein FEK30_08250 [Picosynechococcus sp. PCC 11901]